MATFSVVPSTPRHLPLGPLAGPLGRDLRAGALRDAAVVVHDGPEHEAGIVTEADIADLPEPARRYLRFMGVIGRPRDWSFLVKFSGRFQRPGQPWMPCTAWQYNANRPITRSFHMRIDFARVIPMVGHDNYLAGHGAMRGKVLGLVTVADGSGREFDLGELVTYLNDALVLAPSMLLDGSVVWQGVDDESFDIRLTDLTNTVTARVFVSPDGSLRDFATDDRWYDGPDGLVRARWTTPFQGWSRVDGRPWLTGAQAVWHLPDGPLPYIDGRFVPASVTRNVPPGALGNLDRRAEHERDGRARERDRAPREPIARATANDMMQLASEVGSVPMQVGAVLVLDTAGGFDLGTARDDLATRVPGVPRLRQRLTGTAPGCGRPIWVDDDSFDIDGHIGVSACPAPGDEPALLGCATEILGTRLPDDRPPWRATFVTGLADDRTALVIVFNHVLADGIGGLAVLASLVDGMPPPAGYGFPRPAPPWRAVAVDAAKSRLRAMTRARSGLAHIRAGLAELKPAKGASPPGTSLNVPTGSRRATRAIHVDLDAVRVTAHMHRATVNDVVLAAVTGALRDLLHTRGEEADRFVVSIPISGRRATSSEHLGNDVGVLPVELPATGAFEDRLEAIASITRARKAVDGARGASAVLVGPAMRLLARVGVLRWFLDHQRLINTLVTNLRGPDGHLAFAGASISEVIPISIVTGNVTVGFAVLSYAGTLTITINSDADACPDLETLVRLLDDALTAALGQHETGNELATPAATR